MSSNRLCALAAALLAVAGCKFDPAGVGGSGDDDDTIDASVFDGPPGTHRLTVTVQGDGQVTSSAGGIDCGRGGTACTADLAEGSSVTLTANPAASVTWGGDCSGASCVLTMDADHAVSATFPGPATVEASSDQGSGADDEIRALAVTADGDVIIAGLFGSDDFSLLANPDLHLGHEDGFVARLSPAGQVRWLVVAGGPSDDDAISGLAIDADGDVIITGEIIGSQQEIGSCLETDADGDPLSGTGTDSDVVVARLDGATGNCEWAVRKGGSQDDRGLAVATSGTHAYVVGGFRGTMTFDNDSISSLGGEDILILDVDRSDGSFVNQRGFGGSGTDSARAVAVSAGGTIEVGGVFSSTALLDFARTSQGATDGWLGTLNPTTLAISAVHILAADNEDAINGLAFGPDNVLALAGRYTANAELDGGDLPIANGGNGLIATIESNAVALTIPINTAGDDAAFAVAVGDDGSIFGGGQFGGAFDFGLGTVTPVGQTDLFALKVAADGELAWVLADGSVKTDAIRALAVGGQVVWAGGILGEDADLGSGPLSFGGGVTDGVLIRISR